MFNVDYLRQIENSRRKLFGSDITNIHGVSDEISRRYVPPPTMERIECHEDINREWVPNPSLIK